MCNPIPLPRFRPFGLDKQGIMPCLFRPPIMLEGNIPQNNSLHPAHFVWPCYCFDQSIQEGLTKAQKFRISIVVLSFIRYFFLMNY